jgi:hypothetical protein
LKMKLIQNHQSGKPLKWRKWVYKQRKQDKFIVSMEQTTL